MQDHLRFHERFAPDALEAQYNVRAGRPDFADVAAEWTARSAAVRATRPVQTDIRYGPGERQRLDVYSAGPDAPVLVYFHGGYWQGGDKAMYGLLAETFGPLGISVAVPGYDLCPAVSLTEIGAQARAAMAFLWREAASLGLSRERMTVVGHSAGGHLTAYLLGVDWMAEAPDLPADLIKAGVPISPLSLLEPLRHTSLNTALQMDAQEAEAMSPLLSHPPRTQAPILVVVGGGETDEFQRQAAIYADAFASTATLMTVPEVDHFDIVNALCDPASPFCRAVTSLCEATL